MCALKNSDGSKNNSEEINPFSSIMVDPSLLGVLDFWETSDLSESIFPKIYFPKSLLSIDNLNFKDFYGGYREEFLDINLIIDNYLSKYNNFEPFSFDENTVSKIPEIWLEKYYSLRRQLEYSTFSKQVKSIILEEFVFLAIHSCIVSRLKKSFKVFEETVPLINLEKKAPEIWKAKVRYIKKSISQAEWIAALGLFTLGLNMPLGKSRFNN